LLSFGCELARNKGGAPRILTLSKSSALIDETGERGSQQSLHLLGEVARDSGKEPRSSLKKTSGSLGKSSASSGKKVTIRNLSEKGSSLFVNPCSSQLYDFLLMTLIMDFSEFKNLLRSYPPSRLAKYQEDYALKSSMLGKIAVERLIEQEKVNKQISHESKELKRNFALAQAANVDLEKKVAELAEALKHC
jgi:hypothetical protein